MFISALLMLAKMYKGPNDRRLIEKENTVDIHTMEYYSALNRGKQCRVLDHGQTLNVLY